MKLFNIFKKETKTAKSTIQKMDKTQLEKIVGGLDSIDAPVESTDVLKTKHDTAKNSISNVR